jgi:hypothetical protein
MHVIILIIIINMQVLLLPNTGSQPRYNSTARAAINTNVGLAPHSMS